MIDAAIATLVLMITFLGLIYCGTLINEYFDEED